MIEPMPSWSPDQYLRFAAERARPFDDLVARIRTDDPADVVDLGCGPGNVTRTLLDRWPRAHVHGIDSSPAMIGTATGLAGDRLTFALGDIATWSPEPASLDVVISNAALQWVPEHAAAVPRWISALRPGGTLAIQMPAPARPAEIFREIARSSRWSAALGAVAALTEDNKVVRPADDYADLLAREGCDVDAWETTYIHLLPGEDPVLEWYSGTGLRPYLDALEPDRVDSFRAQVAAALRTAYPRQSYGTLLPFRRIFVVARRSSGRVG